MLLLFPLSLSISLLLLLLGVRNEVQEGGKSEENEEM